MDVGSKSSPESSDKSFVIVGIGASAGGLEALESVFRAMPIDIPAAFVVVQHLSPDFESRMDELLGRQTRLDVKKVHEVERVVPGTIYLAPPSKEMILSNGKLLLTDRDTQQAFSLPIDHMFRSLAQDAGARAVAVVLSGTGSDGSRGIVDVRKAGGYVVCQTPESARFDGMPSNAQKTGCVHVSAPPAEIAQCLVDHISRTARGAISEDDIGDVADAEVAPEGLERIFASLQKHFGIDFSDYKPGTVSRRLERRLGARGIGDIEEYASVLEGDPEECTALYKDLLIGVTKFFRDDEAFDAMENRVIPEIIQKAAPGQKLRIWDAGCATGEEAYSIAILLQEALERAEKSLSVKIFATDVHHGALHTAGAGVYSEEALEGVSKERRERFFQEMGSEFMVRPDIRKMVVFAPHNVLKDAPFTRLDLVVCRNLLIYFSPRAQQKALSLFHFGLRTQGFLFLGSSETPGKLYDEFEAVEDKLRIFRKRRDVRITPDLDIDGQSALRRLPARRTAPGDLSTGTDGMLLSTYDALLARFMPRSFLVDENFKLLHSFGGAEHLLSIRSGRPSSSLLDLAPPSLRTPISGALRHAEKQRAPVRYTGIKLEKPGSDEEESVRLVVTPLVNAKVNTVHYLVALESLDVQQLAPKVDPSNSNPGVRELEPSEASREYVDSLESQLRTTEENLQATVEELETSNEELQATNEELVASNEELQSTNEELHSVNEELYSVNTEHQRKIDELTQMTNDMDNLLQTTDVGVVFLDSELRIRRFTHRAARLFRLQNQDLGRDFQDFVFNAGDEGLEREVRQCFEAGAEISRELKGRDGGWFLLRVVPYQTDDTIDGVVVTLVDIDHLKRSEARIARLSALVEHSHDAVLGVDFDGVITAWNRGAAEMYGYSSADILSKNVRLLVPRGREDELENILDAVSSDEEHEVHSLETEARRKDGKTIPISRTVSPVYDARRRLVGMSFVDRDVSERQRAEREIRAAVEQRERFLALLSHELRNPLATMTSALKMFEEGEGDQRDKAALTLSRQTRHMARLLDDLLDVSRMREDGIEIRRELLDLRDTIAVSLEICASALRERDVSVRTSVPDEPLMIHADPTRMQQVQVNLLTNAAKYSEPGSHIELRVHEDGDFAVIQVEDAGRGIPGDMLDDIFEPFVRVEGLHQDGPRSRSGVGLGLALTKSIVGAHGGTIWAHSDGFGRGSTFEVRIPRVTEMTAAHERTDTPLFVEESTDVETRAGGRPRLLIVEDDDDGREMLCMLCQRRGWDVREARDGHEALRVLEEFAPEAAVVDIGLPGMSGLELGKTIRERYGRTINLFAVTGWGQQSDREKVMEAGFDRHLVKPVDPNLLMELLKRQRAVEN